MKKCYFIFGLMLLMVACTPTATPAPAPLATNVPKVNLPSTVEDDVWINIVKAAKKEGMVVTYTNEMVGDMGANVAEAFKKATGVRLEIVAIGSAARGERIRSEARAGIYVADISDGSATFQALLRTDKLTQALGDLPVFSEKGVWAMDPQIIDPTRHIVYYSPSLTSVWVNTRLVTVGDEPKSWYDLLDPKWKGKKIGVSHPASSSMAYWGYTGLTQRAGFKDEYFLKLGEQDMRFIPGTHRDQNASLARGETHVAFSASATSGLPMMKEGAPIKPLVLKEGSFATGTSMSLLANAPHPNATRVFINWILGQEGQTLFAQAKGDSSMRKDVSDFRPPAGRVNYDPLYVLDENDVNFAEASFSKQVLTKMWIK